MSAEDEGFTFQKLFEGAMSSSRAEAQEAVDRVLAGKEEVIASQPKAETWFEEALAYAVNTNELDLFKHLKFLLSVARYLYKRFRSTAVEWFPVLDTPRKALDDAERWLNVRGHLINVRTHIEVDAVNEARDKAGDPGWTGRASVVYRARIERQFGAANTLAYISRLTSNAILAYGNGLARILASFANELYAVGVKLGELLFSIPRGIKAIYEAAVAFVKQIAALIVYFGNNAAAATINLDYTIYAMVKARQETTFLSKPDALWPDATNYAGFPRLLEGGGIGQYEPRRIGGPRPQ